TSLPFDDVCACPEFLRSLRTFLFHRDSFLDRFLVGLLDEPDLLRLFRFPEGGVTKSSAFEPASLSTATLSMLKAPLTEVFSKETDTPSSISDVGLSRGNIKSAVSPVLISPVYIK
ncbi:1-acyl-sn-glycerol-3-phosphate acyltransferase epsilon, partial [Frankliniella fusca]